MCVRTHAQVVHMFRNSKCLQNVRTDLGIPWGPEPQAMLCSFQLIALLKGTAYPVIFPGHAAPNVSSLAELWEGSGYIPAVSEVLR